MKTWIYEDHQRWADKIWISHESEIVAGCTTPRAHNGDIIQYKSGDGIVQYTLYDVQWHGNPRDYWEAKVKDERVLPK